MTDIQKYAFDPDPFCECGCYVEEAPQGEYVLTDDYDRLTAELKRVKVDLKAAKFFDQTVSLTEESIRNTAEIKLLKAELEQVKVDRDRMREQINQKKRIIQTLEALALKWKGERDRFTKWIPVADFKQEPYEGLCWVCLDNGRVTHAWHTNKQEFLSHAWSENRFDNVSYVIPLFHPQKTLAQEEK